MNVLYDSIIGIGDMAVLKGEGKTIKTFALGSCVAVTVYDPKTKTGGMVHFALPDSNINREKAEEMPGYFGDSGIKALLAKMKIKGIKISKLQVKMVGGANVLNTEFNFDIGKRNILSARKALWKYNLGTAAEDVGGYICRTVELKLDDGNVTVSSNKKRWLL